MKLHLDKQTDALYLRLNEDAVVESEEVEPGVVLDYDDKGLVVGIELLRVSERQGGEPLKDVVVRNA